MARRADKHEVKATQRASGAARTLAETMPRLILEARRIAATVIHGLHGRKRAGPGENFWQYRRFLSGEPARRVDWRRSARDEHLYVREREWEAAHTVWLWPDRSPSMVFRSQLAQDSKLDRTLVVAFALAEVLVQAGERVGMPGLMRPTGSRNVLDKMANAVVHDVTERTSLPPSFSPSGLGEIAVGRAEAWKTDYEARIARHRAEIRAETDRLGWSFAIHRTDHPATELMLALHARMGAPPPGAAVGGRLSTPGYAGR